MAGLIEVIKFPCKMLKKLFPGSKFCVFFIFLGLIKRCYSCRSRGELGSCKDPFRYNASHVDPQPGLTTVPCASGWCGKVIEGETGAFREDGELPSQFDNNNSYINITMIMTLLHFRLRHRDTTNVCATRT